VTKETRPPVGGQTAATLDAMVIRKIDLDSVPRVKMHFQHLLGRASSEKIIADEGLTRRAGDVVSTYAKVAGTTGTQADNTLRNWSLTRAEVAELQDVIAHAERWNRSQIDVSALYDALARYSKDATGKRANPRAYRKALEDVDAVFAPRTHSPMKANRLREGVIPFQGLRSSGFPQMRAKFDDEPRALREATSLLVSDRMPSPCVAAVRVQQKKTGPKTRLVFAYPMSVTLLEGMFAPQLTQRIKEAVPLVTYASGLQEIGMMTSDQRRSKHVLETDFSSFDSSIRADIIQDCFTILRRNFDLNDEQESAWNRVVEYFIHTPILMPDGNIYVTHKGVPSGSWFTNIIDSMVNYLSVRYAVHRGVARGRITVSVLGDDALIGSSEPFDVVKWARVASELGLLMSPEKSKVADTSASVERLFDHQSPYYLGHYWTQSGVWYRPIHVTLARLLYHESYVFGIDVKLLRLARIAAHAMDNPMASVLILHLLTGDPSRNLHPDDTWRYGVVQALYHEAARLGIEDVEATGVTGLSRLLGTMDEADEGPSFTMVAYARNTYAGRLAPAQV
jgi:hypothetical protein